MLDTTIFDFDHKLVGIVAHDAGAANHLVSWIASKRFYNCELKLSFHGPALEIAQKTLAKFYNYSPEELVATCSVLIVGTGWQTDIEFNALNQAATNSLMTISILDHWTNYSKRFIRDDKQILPNRLWVVDSYAQTIAKNELPTVPISIAPNDYIESQVRQINSYQAEATKNKKILFLMEPIRDQWGPSLIEGEVLAFNYLIDNINLLVGDDNFEIIIRPHPSDSDDKYSSLLSSNTKVSSHAVLAEQIAWADIVVGCQTYAMTIALAASKTVVSAIPQSKPRCILPHTDIIHLSDLVEDHEIL